MHRYTDRSASDTTHYLARVGNVDVDLNRWGHRFPIPRSDRADRRKVRKGDARRKLNKITFRYRMKRYTIKPLSDEINNGIRRMTERARAKENKFLNDSDSDSRQRSRSRSRSRSRTPDENEDKSSNENNIERDTSDEDQDNNFQARSFRRKKKKRVAFANRVISNQNEVRINSDRNNEDKINFDDPLLNLRRNSNNLNKDELQQENKILTK